MNIIQKVAKLVKRGVSIEAAIPEGADPSYWQKILANYDPNAKPKRKTSRSRAGGRSRKMSTAAAIRSLTFEATLEAVNRVNHPEECSPVFVNINGEFVGVVEA